MDMPGCTGHTCAHLHVVDTVDVRCLPQYLPILLLLYSTLVSKLAPWSFNVLLRNWDSIKLRESIQAGKKYKESIKHISSVQIFLRHQSFKHSWTLLPMELKWLSRILLLPLLWPPLSGTGKELLYLLKHFMLSQTHAPFQPPRTSLDNTLSSLPHRRKAFRRWLPSS